ncbi:Metallo-hydrolase/oxidoreductase [Violaceomyces palustris]|uniref:Metallo-hydrolase/oxidoreductase n=1 Tax=Violaceomyces palustris TaxID=1673888 RepID=A0ACD0NZ19_9BASI|nr:Metallo-hydrolase/oxidoreductase [Violaceomyces palustris]
MAPLSVSFKPQPHLRPPPHHVLAPAYGTTWSSYLPHWSPQPESHAQHGLGAPPTDSQQAADLGSFQRQRLPEVRTGFQNPWDSWHKPTLAELWQGLRWGQPSEDEDGVGVGDTDGDRSKQQQSLLQYISSTFNVGGEGCGSNDPASEASALLKVVKPDFEFDVRGRDRRSTVKTTWLGHAGVLLQLAPLDEGGQEPIRILFDPIFSQRCSPTQLAGPLRSYLSPCQASDLPPIDLVVISHNHYDHLDYNTILEVWRLNSHKVRFIVPLGNRAWFVQQPLSIPSERVLEMDWWDEAYFTSADAEEESRDGGSSSPKPAQVTAGSLKVVCTPAQHGSGRYGLDTNCSLWSSWFLELSRGGEDAEESFKIFFGGDTGFQFHGPDFPPKPPKDFDSSGKAAPVPPTTSSHLSDQGDEGPSPRYRDEETEDDDIEAVLAFASKPNPPPNYAYCPAFEEISIRLGSPDLSLLPISVGATISFLRSYVPVPDSISPFPRIGEGLTSANHMAPWDAVRVFRILSGSESALHGNGQTSSLHGLGKDRVQTEALEEVSRGEVVDSVGGKGGRKTTCLAIHWGTFVSGYDEVIKTLRQLEYACQAQGVQFRRGGGLESNGSAGDAAQENGVARADGAEELHDLLEFFALDHGQSIVL